MIFNVHFIKNKMNIWKGLIPGFDKKEIATGSYSSVYKMKFYNNVFAIKVSKFVFSSIDIREIATMLKLNHPNIMNILSVWINEDLHFIYLMPLAKTSLLNITIVKYLIYMEPNVRRDFFKGLFSALEYLHSQNIWHRDIKPSNILIFEGNIPKLCDFGLAAVLTNVHSKFLMNVVTEYWKAPELFKKKPYDEKIDIWSLGLIMFELHITFYRNRYHPFVHSDLFEKEKFKDTKTEERIDLLKNIDKLMLIFPSIEDEAPVIKACLEFDPKKRKCASEILAFDYFKDAVDILRAEVEPEKEAKYKYIGEIDKDLLMRKLKYHIVQEDVEPIVDITKGLLDKYSNCFGFSLETIKKELLVCFMYIAAIILSDNEILIPLDLYKNILWILVELNFNIL